jgi:hypothetical protein
VSSASAADLRLLRGAFRASGIDLQTQDIAYARSTPTIFEAEVSLREGQVVQPWRRADSALVLELERHADSGANATAKVVDIASGKITAETRRVALRPRPPYQTSGDEFETQFTAVSQALGDLQKQRALAADSPTADRRAAPRVIPTSVRDIVLDSQRASFVDLSIRGMPEIGIQDLGANRNRIVEENRSGKSRKSRDKDADKAGGKDEKDKNQNKGLQLGDLLVSVGGGPKRQIAPGSRVNIEA